MKIGLTGGIAVGKSYVCDVLREAGCAVLDADLTARDVVAQGTIGLKKIVENFGKEILHADGSLDRAKLGAIVFADESKRQLLNSIVHPLVFEAQENWLKAQEAENSNIIAVIDAALMVESGNYKRFEKIIVVWCEAETQINRLMTRNNLSRQEALKRINSQMPQKEKKKFADFLIDTTDGFEAAKQQTIGVFNELKIYNSNR